MRHVGDRPRRVALSGGFLERGIGLLAKVQLRQRSFCRVVRIHELLQARHKRHTALGDDSEIVIDLWGADCACRISHMNSANR
jgi:hypothetical protein